MVRSSAFVALVALVSLAALSSCADYDDSWGYGNANEIVFGVRQRTDATTGKTEVTAGYEFLGLAHKGGWATSVYRDGDGDGTCYFERFDARLGRPRVESGVATFAGGQLPPAGLQLLANQPDVTKHEGVGWATHDMLSFDASGFAMPPLVPFSMRAPRVELDGIAVTPALAEGATMQALEAKDDVAITWAPPASEELSRVVVSLETAEANGLGGEVRCFGSAESGSLIIPSRSVARLFSSVDPGAPIEGRLSVASHRQVTILARGSWTVYVVATTVHHEQAFHGIR